MNTIQKILVPLDTALHSAPVIELAAELCRKHEAAVTLLHVWDPLRVSTPRNEQLFDSSAAAHDLNQLKCELEAAADALRARGAFRVDISLEHGRADREILAFAAAGKFDLIIMGTHGRTGFSHVLIGSVAERVVRRAHCPVMTVRLTGPQRVAARVPMPSDA